MPRLTTRLLDLRNHNSRNHIPVTVTTVFTETSKLHKEECIDINCLLWTTFPSMDSLSMAAITEQSETSAAAATRQPQQRKAKLMCGGLNQQRCLTGTGDTAAPTSDIDHVDDYENYAVKLDFQSLGSAGFVNFLPATATDALSGDGDNDTDNNSSSDDV
jgi:hypothetical protein